MIAIARFGTGVALAVGLALLMAAVPADAAKATITITGKVKAAEQRNDKITVVFIADLEQGEFVATRGTEIGKELIKLVGKTVRATGYPGEALREKGFDKSIDVLEYELVPEEGAAEPAAVAPEAEPGS